MATKLQNIRWKLYQYKDKTLLLWGLKNGLIAPYSDELIEKLRTIYYGPLPASVILLSNAMTNGHCYDRALLLSRAFIDSDDEVNLLYGDVNYLKLNPEFICNDPRYADHCFVERKTKDGKHLIYDTTTGFVYDKDLYWLINHPKIRHKNDKESIKRFLDEDEQIHTNNIENDKYASPILIDFLLETYGRPNEMYAANNIELLQREIENFKQTIKYDELVEEIDQDMKRLGLRH